MVFVEVTIDLAHELSEFFLCELVLFGKSLNLCVCILESCVRLLEAGGVLLELFVRVLEKVHNEAKTLVNKTRKVTDIFRGSVHSLLSFSLSCLQVSPFRIKLGLLLKGPLYVSFESSVEFFVSHK